jgi:hypothetical protein
MVERYVNVGADDVVQVMHALSQLRNHPRNPYRVRAMQRSKCRSKAASQGL